LKQQTVYLSPDSFVSLMHIMNSKELQNLIKKREGVKLEFKQRLYEIHHDNKQVRDRHWNEFVKDILSLANGGVDSGKEEGYLVIGVGDTLNSNGTRELFDVDVEEVKLPKLEQKILDRVNKACQPPLPNVHCEIVAYNGCNILVVSIPFSPHLHQTTRSMTMSNNSTYPENTIFIRRSEGIRTATVSEIDEIRKKKLQSGESGYASPLDKRIYLLREQQDRLREQHIEEQNKLREEQNKLRKQQNKPSDDKQEQIEQDIKQNRWDIEQTSQNIEQIEQDIEQRGQIIDYLQEKKKYQQQIEGLYGKERGKISYLRAEAVIKQREIWQEKDPERKDLIYEMNEEIKECLEDAIEHGHKRPVVYCKLAHIYNLTGIKILEAFKHCREAIRKKKDYREAYEVGIEICSVLMGYDNSYRDIAKKKLPEYQQELERLRGDSE
jgi:hypothetical protein